MRISDYIGRNMLAPALVTIGIGILGGCGGDSATSTGKAVPDNTVEQQSTQDAMQKQYDTQAKKK